MKGRHILISSPFNFNPPNKLKHLCTYHFPPVLLWAILKQKTTKKELQHATVDSHFHLEFNKCKQAESNNSENQAITFLPTLAGSATLSLCLLRITTLWHPTFSNSKNALMPIAAETDLALRAPFFIPKHQFPWHSWKL